MTSTTVGICHKRTNIHVDYTHGAASLTLSQFSEALLIVQCRFWYHRASHRSGYRICDILLILETSLTATKEILADFSEIVPARRSCVTGRLSSAAL